MTLSSKRALGNMEMGGRIKKRRLELGLTQEEVAEILDITVWSYQSIEGGRRGISTEIAVKLKNTLHMNIDYMLTGQLSQNNILIEKLEACPAEKLSVLDRLLDTLLELVK